MKETLEIWHLIVGFAGIIIAGVYKFSANNTKVEAKFEKIDNEINYLKKSNEKRVTEIAELEKDVKNELKEIREVMVNILTEVKLFNERINNRNVKP
jgi:predicted  nucleic acid-binding Zn-ribbon protein